MNNRYKNNPLLIEINNVVIRFILDLYNNGDNEGLKQLGVSQEVARQLSTLSVRNSERLTKCQQLLGDIFIDEKRLKQLIKYVLHNDAKDSFVNQLIKMQASQTMLEHLAGVDHQEFRQRRILMGLPEANAGRPGSLADAESSRLLESWHHHRDKEHDLLQHYFYVGIDTGIPLSKIWYHMHTYEVSRDYQINNSQGNNPQIKAI